VNAGAKLVGHDELGRFISDVLVKHGASAHDAAIVAQGLVWANLRGGDGHGVSPLPRYVKLLAQGEIDPKAQPRLVHDRGATLMVDGGHGFGPVAVMEAAARAIERTRQTGICLALIRHTTHTGAIGRYAQWIRRARLRRGADGRGADFDGLSRRARGQHGDEPDCDRGAERRRPHRSRHGDQHHLQR
jgi:LDH2 family malate/lactate/ureidoglycolate dehydrogenase